MKQDIPEGLKAEMWQMWVNKITHELLHENVQLVYLGWLTFIFVSAEGISPIWSLQNKQEQTRERSVKYSTEAVRLAKSLSFIWIELFIFLLSILLEICLWAPQLE